MSEWLILLLVFRRSWCPPYCLLASPAAASPLLPVLFRRSRMRLAWASAEFALTVSYSTALRGFEFERKRLPELTVETFTVDASTSPDTFGKLDDTHYRVMDRQLERKTLYLYRVRAIDNDGSFSSWSNPLEPDILAEHWISGRRSSGPRESGARQSMHRPGKASASYSESRRAGWRWAATSRGSLFVPRRTAALRSSGFTSRSRTPPLRPRQWTR